MAKDPLLPNSPRDDDTWQSLAGDLFGIDFDKTPQSEEIVTPEELAADQAEQTRVSAGEAEEPPPADDEDPISGIADSDGEDEVEESEDTSQQGSDETEPADREEDAFWDPLDSWQWNDDEQIAAPSSSETELSVGADNSDRKGKSDGKGEAVTATPAETVAFTPVPQSEAFPTAADFREEYVEDSDFGAGLLSEDEPPESLAAEAGAAPSEKRDETVNTDDADGAPRRRRRRRRRRPRTETSTDPTKPEVDEPVSESPPADSEATKRPSRRGSRRRRKPESKAVVAMPPTAHEDSTTDDTDSPAAEDEERGSAFDEESRPSGKSPYPDIPTWEEAIACLLHPQATANRTADQPEENKTGAPHQSRSSGRRGRRRPSK